MRGVVKAKPGRAQGGALQLWAAVVTIPAGAWGIDQSRSPEDIGGRAGMYSEAVREAIFLVGGLFFLLGGMASFYAWLCIRGSLARAYARRTKSGVKIAGALRLLCGGGLHVPTGTPLEVEIRPLANVDHRFALERYQWIFSSGAYTLKRWVWFNAEQADLDLLTNTLRELADVEVRFLGSSPPEPGE